MRLHAFLLLILGLAGLLPGIQRLVPERQQELRVVLVAQHMARGGSWLIPQFQRRPRLKKPPLAYWAAAVCAKPFGGEAPIWVYRVPGRLAGIGLLFAIWAVGRRLLGDPAAFAAAALAGLSFCLLRHARLAETDVMLSMFIVWSIWAGTRTAAGRPLRFWALCGLFAGLGFLTKGLAAAVVPPLALTGIGWFRRDLLRVSLPGFALGLLAFAAVAAPWYLAIWTHPEAQAALRSEAFALMGENQHTGPIVYYLYTGLVQLLPWSLLLLLLPFRRRELTTWKPVAAWFACVLLLLSVLPSKQAHYCVLLLAPASLLLATWTRVADWMTARRVGGLAALVGVLSLVHVWVIAPRINPLQALPAYAELPELTGAPLVHVVGANSAIFEFQLGHMVHNIDSTRAALARARPGEVVWVSGKETSVDLPGEHEATPLRLDRDGEWVHALYRK